MNVERLKTLAAYLRALDAPPSFWQRVKAWFTAPPVVKPFNMFSWSCNTSACALGHAAEIPAFKAQGLGLEVFPELEDDLDENGNRMLHANPTFRDVSGYSAGAAFFDISYSASDFLFSPESYIYEERITPSMVADQIDILLAHNGEPPEVVEEAEDGYFDHIANNYR